MFEAAPCALALLDEDGVVVRANAEFLRLVALPHDQVVGARTLSSLLTLAGKVLVETHLTPVLGHTGSLSEVALDVVRADGERVPIILNAVSAPGPDASSTLVAALETRDRHRYEDDLVRARRSAEAALDHAAALAETLQQTLIPPHPPTIAHLQLAAAYRPAGDGSEVGGDFYDIFQVAPDRWVIVLGDVSGKGAAAAAVTSFVRYTLRALAAVHRDPAEILYLLDGALDAHLTDRYCTVAVLLMERADDDWVLMLALGGHPPAVLRAPDGSVRELGEHGTPVGLVATPAFHTVHQHLGRHTLTLYTDGVTEARSDQGLFGDTRLMDLIAGLPHEPSTLTDTIVQAALAWQANRASDDIAVVTIASH